MRNETPLTKLIQYHKTGRLALFEKNPSEELKELRISLLEEEVKEFIESLREGDNANALKELADIVYVAYGAAASFGWDLDTALNRVHNNNMERMRQPDGTIKYREDGKLMKNPHTPKVNLSDLI